MSRVHAKLTEEQQYQVCQWYAEFKTPRQIKNLVKERFGIELTDKTVWQYSRGNQMKKWKPMIERLRQEWALGVMDIPLAHKRGRMEELTKLYEQAIRNKDVTEYTRVNQCLAVLREMRDEMEAGKSEFTNVYLTTIHQYPDEEVLKLREAVLARIKALGGKNGIRRHGEEAVEAELTGGDGEGAVQRREPVQAASGQEGQPEPEAPRLLSDAPELR